MISEELETLTVKFRPSVERLMDVETPPWVKDSGESMEFHYTDLTLKTEDKTSASNSLVDYKDLFQQDKLNLNQVIKIVLKGDPGIGKSTLCRKITWNWARGALTTFKIIFLIVPKFVKTSDSIERIILSQYPMLEGFNINEKKLKAILEILGDKCLLIFDGYEESSLSKNVNVQKIINGQMFANCNVLLASRPQSVRGIVKLFHRTVTVDGFALDEARQFAGRVLNDSQKVDCVVNFRPKELRAEQNLLNSPMLLSILCYLYDSNEIDVSLQTMFTGEIYTRIVRCLYKTYLVRKQTSIKYDDDNFLLFMILLGNFVLKTLRTKNYLFKEKEIDQKVLEYGIIIGHKETQKLTSNETADIYVR